MLLGIDIGGTTINLGLVKDNQIVHIITVPSFAPDATLEETLQHLENAIKQIVTPEVTKIGIGVPTYVDSEKGIVYDAMNIPSWTVVPLKERLEKASNKHTIIFHITYGQHQAKGFQDSLQYCQLFLFQNCQESKGRV